MTVPRVRAAGLAHAARAGKNIADIGADQRRRHQTKDGQSGITAADIVRRTERCAEMSILGEFLQRRAGIGDGDKVAAGIVFYLLQLVPKIVEE